MFEKRKNNTLNIFNNNRAQVTIFIIIAVVIVAAVAVFFMFRGSFQVAEVPANLEPAYASFLSCIEQDTFVGISVLESQGGYIELPDFVPGSAYMPFSSQLNFLGNPIPYWYYVTGNNLQAEQIPSKTLMEEQLADFVSDRISNCALNELYGEGYTIIMGENPEAEVTINENDIDVTLNVPLRLEKANDTVLVSNHRVVVESQLGGLYASAREIYEYEQDTLFLENYAVDTLRLYAPVDGVEIECSPKVWSADEIFDELESAIQANVAAIKVDTADLTLTNEDDKYFIVDLPVDENVRFLNSRLWPHSFDVNPSDGPVMIAEPVGNQPGMAALGFCYVPYHFVYDMNYPVLVQVYSDTGEEIFQFPFAVVVRGNRPREPIEGAKATSISPPELCKYPNTEMTVNTYDNNINPINTNVGFSCLGDNCDLGTTSEGSFTGLFPQCVNGIITVSADGFEDTDYIVNSVEEGAIVDIFLLELFEKRVELRLDGTTYSESAIVNFIDEQNQTESIIYPEQNTISLKQGEYDIEVYIYRNASIELEEQTEEYCMEVSEGGLGALVGLTKEKCFDVNIPSQTISNALMGGGKETYYMIDSELQSTNIIDINAKSLDNPRTVDDLQKNYDLFETLDLDILFR